MSIGEGWRPINGKVAILPDPNEEKTPGGIILPPVKSGERKGITGKVVSVASNTKLNWCANDPCGHRVAVSRRALTDEVHVNGQTFVLVNEDDILMTKWVGVEEPQPA